MPWIFLAYVLEQRETLNDEIDEYFVNKLNRFISVDQLS